MMVGDITIADEIYIVCNSTDMRKSIDGLCVIIRDHLHIDPESRRAIFLFCGKRRDRIKILFKEPDGWTLLYKRLDRDAGKFSWPRNKDEVKPITWTQFSWLMSGLDIEQPKAIRCS